MYQQPANHDETDARPPLDSCLAREPSRGVSVEIEDDHEYDGDDYEYNMTHKRRGVAIIINNKDFASWTGLGRREGTDRDADSMDQMFESLGFQTEMHINLSQVQMMQALKNVARMDHSDCDCVAVAILSHGDDKGVVYGTDGPVTLTRLIYPFKSDQCLGLVGKPKLFFIQACRGNAFDYGMLTSDSPSSTDTPPEESPPVKIPQEADVLIAFSTVQGHFSWRNTDKGSFYVQTLCKIMAKHGKQLELQRLLLRVNNEVAKGFESNTGDQAMSGMKQMPSIENQLRKELYFKPK